VKSWVKLYTESNRDPKIGSLSWVGRGIWAALLALAGEIDDRDAAGAETGRLDTRDAVAWRIRCDLETLTEALAAFTDRGMVHEDEDGVLVVSQYGVRQARPPSSSRNAVAERVKRHRARVTRGPGSACNEGVTTLHGGGNDGETTAQRGVTPSETESDTETDTPASQGARLEPGAPRAEQGKDAGSGKVAPGDTAKAPSRGEGTRHRRSADPRTKHPAIQCVKGILGGRKLPPLEMYDAIIELLGERPNGTHMAACRQEWVERGYNRESWKWLTEWYVHGIPAQQGAPGARASPHGPPLTGGNGAGMSEEEAALTEVALGPEYRPQQS